MPGLGPGIHAFRAANQDVDGIGPLACPSSALLSDASRVNSTCVDTGSRRASAAGSRLGHDAGVMPISTHPALINEDNSSILICRSGAFRKGAIDPVFRSMGDVAGASL